MKKDSKEKRGGKCLGLIPVGPNEGGKQNMALREKKTKTLPFPGTGARFTPGERRRPGDQ